MVEIRGQSLTSQSMSTAGVLYGEGYLKCDETQRKQSDASFIQPTFSSWYNKVSMIWINTG